MHRYANKTAIVTGGASGIGFSLATHLVGAGARVLIADIRNANEAAKRLGCEAVSLDVTDSDAVSEAIRSFHDREGRLDYIFNNAGVFLLGEARLMELADWNHILDVNVRGVVNGVAAAYPLMIAQGSGHIVNTASVAGLVATPSAVAYSASKHAVLGLSLALRPEAAHHGVRVTAICPGFIRTPMADSSGKLLGVERRHTLDFVDQYFGWMTPEDLAEAALRGVLANQPTVVAPRSARIASRAIRASRKLQEHVGTMVARQLHKFSS